MMDYQPEEHGREPFPWLGISLGLLAGLVVMPLLSWTALELLDGSNDLNF